MRISVDLSERSCAQAAAAIRQRARTFESRLDELCRRLAEAGMDAAVRAVPVMTGDLRDSIRVERRGEAEYLVVAENGHAAFVEFGTGVVGEGTYRGELPGSWEYDQRRTPAAHDPLDPTKWYYRDPATGQVRATRGRRAAGYMLAASEEMRRQARRIAGEVFA